MILRNKQLFPSDLDKQTIFPQFYSYPSFVENDWPLHYDRLGPENDAHVLKFHLADIFSHFRD